mgnify:CR=1 FL=1
MLLPFSWLTLNLDVENTQLLVGFSFISLLSAGLMEWIHPYSMAWRRSHGDVLTDIAHQVLTSFFAQFLRVFLVVGFFLAINRNTDDFALTAWPHHWPLWLQAMLGLVVAEFGDYWRHRAFHKWHLPWRTHAIHHSPIRVYFLNANRFHVLDACVASLAGAIPLALCGASTEVVVLVGIFTGLHGPWQHANVNYRLGWLNWIISGAELHRWHHSTNPEECNSNYGNNLIVWDILFGTRYLPNKTHHLELEWLASDLANFPRAGLKQQLAPFRWKLTQGLAESLPER